MKILIFLFIFFPFSCFCQEKQAITAIQKATLSYPIIQQTKKNLEQKLFNYIPLSKENATIAGTMLLTGAMGKFETKNIKKMDLELFGGKIRPDITYNFRNQEFLTVVNLNIEF